jgi:hypothetical protein
MFSEERWKRRWVAFAFRIALAASVRAAGVKPGLVAGGIADIGGLLVVVALVGMLVASFGTVDISMGPTEPCDEFCTQSPPGGQPISGGVRNGSLRTFVNIRLWIGWEHLSHRRLRVRQRDTVANGAIDAYTSTKYDYGDRWTSTH